MDDDGKKKFLLIIGAFAILFALSVNLTGYFNSKKSHELTKIEYRTDVEPITKRFGEMLSIESCFWKAKTIGKANFGPSSYWMKGYILISQENADFLKSKYDFTDVDINFENGMEPDITGKSNFKWSYNKEFSKKIVGAEFVGEFYFDVENNIFYFDLESN